jgi:hypothetical protein
VLSFDCTLQLTGVDLDHGKPQLFIERQNLTMRMSMRRFTRLTNAFSKKLENLQASVAMHLARYNLVRPHKTLRVTTSYLPPGLVRAPAAILWRLGSLLDIQRSK